jgi:alginate O-acetyltransferase complex protein AlgI
LIFNTSWFLYFFIAFYALLWLVPNARLRFYYVLACSAVFHYQFAGPAGITPIIIMAVITFYLAQWMDKLPADSAQKKRVFTLALLVPIFGLIFYKYRALLIGSSASMIGGDMGKTLTEYAVQPAMPLAISFFTFEFVHYLTDIYHGKGKPVTNPFKFGIFCIFFPSIVSGPIKRFQPFLAQMENGLERPRGTLAAMGLAQVLLGFFKKLVIADNATMLIHLLEKRTDLTFGPVCLLMSLLSIRILFDFSGYSDIAIGLGKMIGLELPPNFNFPYIARNITDFWRRWHMSLSSWIREYIYIPMGGNRSGPLRKFINLLTTMFVCGLWHGASWHFGIWGIYHGLGLTFHNAWEKIPLTRRWAAWGPSRWIDMAITNVFVAYGWLLFFYPMDEVFKITKCLFKF